MELSLFSKLGIKLRVGTKVYGLATFILILLMAVAGSSYQQMRRVNREISDLANYIIPLKKTVATINLYALEQEVHFERILRIYEIEPLNSELLAIEQEKFDLFGDEVNQQFNQAFRLAEQALEKSHLDADLIEFARMEPLFEVLQADYQNFIAKTREVMALVEQGQKQEAQILDRQLEEQEAILNDRIYNLLVNLDQFAAATARQVEVHEQNLLVFNFWIATLATLLGLTLAVILTQRLTRPIKTLMAGVAAVESGNLETQVQVQSGDEVETLAQSFNAMVQEVRQKQVLKEAFGQYVDPRIVETLMSQEPETNNRNNGRKAEVTVFFSDLAKFSTISEMLTPDRLVSLINQYLTLATLPITETQGVIDKFIGDAIVAFWGPPFVPETDHAGLACRAALEQLGQLMTLQRLLPDIVGIRKGLPQLGVRVGLDTGELVIGNVGTDHLQSYTIIGPTVEVAETLEGANKRYGTQILLTERTRELAGETIEVREIDRLPLGPDQSLVSVYELLSYGTALDGDTAELRDQFGQGLAHFRQEDWHRAKACFQTCLKIHPKDGPSQFYLQQLNP
jgi:adenylate cyclase